MAGALDGIRVADLSRVLAGPYATMLLADLGAQVFKVERPPLGDDTRQWGPPFDADGVSTYYDSVNRNKHALAIDLASETGRRDARALIRSCDVVVENFVPGTMERFGLGYQQLAAEQPALIYASISGFGRTPEAAAMPGYDLLVQAVGGLMSITGPDAQAPTKVGVALVDVVTGLHCAFGILAALRHRDATGEGQRVDVSLLGSLLSGLVNQAGAYVGAGVVPRAMGNAHPSIAPYETFDTADRVLALAVGNDTQFRACALAVGRPALADDERFRTNPLRVANRAALHDMLQDALIAQSAEHWTQLFRAAGVPSGPVNGIDEAFALATRLGLSPIADAGGIPTVAHPVRFSRTPAEYRLRPPAIGSTDLQELL
ncbi:MAG: CaiB/BaiF CoA transferase family protein [Candidatus Nanopelagicales bacterium]